MVKKNTKTYHDHLMEDSSYRNVFEKEYVKLCISEEIAKVRHEANLTQAALAKRIHTSKSAVSRYENGRYDRYSIPLLRRIAAACGVELRVSFTPKNGRQQRTKRQTSTALVS